MPTRLVKSIAALALAVVMVTWTGTASAQVLVANITSDPSERSFLLSPCSTFIGTCVEGTTLTGDTVNGNHASCVTPTTDNLYLGLSAPNVGSSFAVSYRYHESCVNGSVI